MTVVYCMIPIVLQGVTMVVDEGWFHRRRGLPRWERIGHPLDTLTLVVCLAWLVATTPASPVAVPVYVGLALFSTLFVTKDEAVHARLCSPGEHWLHAMLFVLHPIVLAAFAYLWWLGAVGLLMGQLGIAIAFMAYQVIYWSLEDSEPEPVSERRPRSRKLRYADSIVGPVVADTQVSSAQAAGTPVNGTPVNSTQAAGTPVNGTPVNGAKVNGAKVNGAKVNNTWYADLGSRWYAAEDTPIALLRAESRHRNPWIAGEIARAFAEPCRVLDLGCGGGFLSNYLAERGHQVTGVDTTAENLTVARANDRSRTAQYHVGDARALEFRAASFDVVCAMDLLEHVEEPGRVIAEASRVLVPGGLFVFHTFNRTWQAKLIVIKGVEWFVRNAPHDLHVQRLFVKPDELRSMCRASGLEVAVIHGSRPRFGWPLLRMLTTGKVGDDFAFTTTPSLKLGYTGFARKVGEPTVLGAVLHPLPGARSRQDLCDGSHDAQVLVDEVRAGPVRDRGSRAR
jgi:2-polyprenyl-6-hydroxyphenyl methylase / 3-demethylubiquinone-9 3-methyltransferase